LSKGTKYDYIIAGMGCAGLSLAVRLSKSNVNFTKVLVLDKSHKNKNDRTWCFWDKESHHWYEPIVHKKWNQFSFRSPGFEKKFDLLPYHYKLIRGVDFYTYCLDELKKDRRFEFVQDELLGLSTHENYAEVKCAGGNYRAGLVFNSALRVQNIKTNHVNYVQHFMGWVVETKEACFDETCPVFMDFNTDQENDFRFFYLIPYSKTKALVEYTGFSPKALEPEVYAEKLKAYFQKNHPGTPYTVLETELGSIPMAESAFVNPYGKRIINIGTAGGHSKPSTGYTFYFIQKYTAHLISQMERGKAIPIEPKRKKRFLFYDKVMLYVLHQKTLEGRAIFTRLFEKNKIENLLDFLNESSGWITELKITGSMNSRFFLASAIKKLFAR
jgi:lycopene beta-cyclase